MERFLNFASRLYKYNFDDSILIYAQKPDATAVADMRLWNKRIGRYVNKGTKSIVVFNTVENDLKLQYLFDVSDINGPLGTIPKAWKLNNEISKKLVNKLNNSWGIEEENLENIISKQIKNTPGGIIAFVTSKGTMDNENDNVRRYLSERAELIGAVRLPNTAFKDNANTEVTTDIIFLQKRERLALKEADWLNVEKNEDGIPVNEYFIRNPEMMLGKMIIDTRMYGEDSKYTNLINNDENFDLEISLNNAIEKLSANISEYQREVEYSNNVIPANQDVKDYTYTLIDNNIYYRENTKMRKMDITGTNFERIKGLHSIKEITREIIDIQINGCTEKELNPISIWEKKKGF